jgi:hypothetical protein
VSDTRTRAGRELDAEVAEKVFGYWDVCMYDGELVHGENNMNGWPVPTPRYSKSMDEAWSIVHKLRCEGVDVQIDSYGLDGWRVCLSPPDAKYAFAEANTAPLAICKAALKLASAKNPPENPAVFVLP